jgi:hypothetical protein
MARRGVGISTISASRQSSANITTPIPTIVSALTITLWTPVTSYHPPEQVHVSPRRQHLVDEDFHQQGRRELGGRQGHRQAQGEHGLPRVGPQIPEEAQHHRTPVDAVRADVAAFGEGPAALGTAGSLLRRVLFPVRRWRSVVGSAGRGLISVSGDRLRLDRPMFGELAELVGE